MPELRYLRAGRRALPLLQDILEAALNGQSAEVQAMLHDDFAELLNAEDNPGVSYIVGFEDHVPIGYVKCIHSELILELVGPFLYVDYATVESSSHLIRKAKTYMESQESRLVFALIPESLVPVGNSYPVAGFDEVSDQPELIKRWRDGLLADRLTAAGSILYAQLIDSDLA